MSIKGGKRIPRRCDKDNDSAARFWTHTRVVIANMTTCPLVHWPRLIAHEVGFPYLNPRLSPQRRCVDARRKAPPDHKVGPGALPDHEPAGSAGLDTRAHLFPDFHTHTRAQGNSGA